MRSMRAHEANRLAKSVRVYMVTRRDLYARACVFPKVPSPEAELLPGTVAALFLTLSTTTSTTV